MNFIGLHSGVSMSRAKHHTNLLKIANMRSLLLMICIFCATNVSANSSAQARWEFEVLLDGKKIGYHEFTVSNDDGVQKVRMEARFDVKLLFVNVFSYRHQNEEVWEGNCLYSITSETKSNGKEFSVSGRASGDEFQLQSLSSENTLPRCIMTFAYWNPDFLMADQLLNGQTGEYEMVEITREGEETLAIDGQDISAIRYTINGTASPITLWYAAADQRWLALESVVNGGRVLRYEPVSLPDLLPSAFALTDSVSRSD